MVTCGCGDPLTGVNAEDMLLEHGFCSVFGRERMIGLSILANKDYVLEARSLDLDQELAPGRL